MVLLLLRLSSLTRLNLQDRLDHHPVPADVRSFLARAPEQRIGTPTAPLTRRRLDNAEV